MNNTPMETEIQRPGLPPGRAGALARGVSRMLGERGCTCLTEFRLRTGRRVDLIALDRFGDFTIVEVKTSAADFRSDGKWQEYLPYCDRFYFAVPEDFPHAILPAACGLIVADGYGGAILREASPRAMSASRRKALTMRFARTAAYRLMRFIDPRTP